MKLKINRQVRRSLIVGSAILPLVVLGLVFQNCARQGWDLSSTEVGPTVNAKSMVGPCQGSVNLGVWFSMWTPSGDVLSMTPDCHGSSSHCESEFAYSKPSALTGQMTLRVSKTKSMPTCPTVGDHICDYEILVNDKKMRLRCDNAAWLEYELFAPVDGGAVKAPPSAAAPTPVVPEPPPLPPTPELKAPPVPPTSTPPKMPVRPLLKPAPLPRNPKAKTATVDPVPVPSATATATPTAAPVRAPASVPASGDSKVIYVSSSVYSGNLGGISGADMKCQSDPARPASVSSAKALISDGFHRVACANPLCDEGVDGQADWPLKPSTSYYDVSGNHIGTTNGFGIFIGPAIATAAFTNVKAWTGIKIDWTSSNEHCSSWSQTVRSTGMFGTPAANGNFMLGSGSKLCDGQGLRLICVEQ